MKLSEQECAESLGYIWNLAIDEVDRRRIPYDDLRKSVKTLQKLIEEHFDKETQKKPKGISVTHEGRVGNCPSCRKFIREEQNKNFCDCGQKIDWSEYETN